MNIKTLSARQLEAAIEKQDAICRDAVERMIAGGRGRHTFSDIRKAALENVNDLLALHYCGAMDLSSALEREKQARLTYHGKLTRVKARD